MYTIVKTAGDIIVMSRVCTRNFGCWNIDRVMRVNRMQFEYVFSSFSTQI